MVGASKILTVSYGTFSCTLEGFDDSFGTMKAIAEYFRDLAAEDRFFGAEPPSPDTEMLQRIAEREIRKRVEARIGEDGIVLRQVALTADDATPVFAEDVPTFAAARPPSEDAGRGADEPESVAAKLARIRAVVENARAAAPAGLRDEAPAPRPAPATEGHPDPKSPDPAAEAPDMPQPRKAAEPRAETGEGADDLAEVDSPAAALSEPAGEPRADAIPSIPNRADIRAEDGSTPAAQTAPDRPAAPVPPPPRARARVLKLKREDLAVHWPGGRANETAPADPEDDARLPDALEAELQADLAAARAAFEQPGETAHDETAAPAATVLDEPSTGGTAAEAQETPRQDAIPASGEVAGDAACAAEDTDDRSRTADANPAGAWMATEPAARRPAPDPGQVETALQRLWDETNTKLDGAEQKRRRASIAHLKAAVAATFADREAGRSGHRNTEEEAARRPYRQVLAKVVRGNRDETGNARPGERSRLAPLMLVSEQRIDTVQPDPRDSTEAIRPRRDTPADADGGARAVGNIFAAETGFAEFAEARGASAIAEMLAAAAAYLQSIEGQEQFSRQQVLRLTMDHMGKATSREDVLNAFGDLLRDGTFKKVTRGNFALSAVEPGGGAPEAERRQA